MSREFIEIYLDASLAVYEARDPKGLYKRARAGDIKQFTGIDSPYEPPLNAELVLNTGESTIAACLDQILSWLRADGRT